MPAGNLYIADFTTNEVRVVNSSTHIITNAAGNVFGLNAYSGDGGAATSATFESMYGVAVSPVSGFVYVADSNNNRVRFVDGSGTITTFVAPTMTIPQAFIEPFQQADFEYAEFGADDSGDEHQRRRSHYFLDCDLRARVTRRRIPVEIALSRRGNRVPCL